MRCTECGREVEAVPGELVSERKPCVCGATARIMDSAAADFPTTRWKLREGPGRPIIEGKNELRWNHDRQTMERRVELYNRESNRYIQRWFDLDTDEVTFEKEGDLDDPAMHGKSARRGKPQGQERPTESNRPTTLGTGGPPTK
jgi:hypothetical protein